MKEEEKKYVLWNYGEYVSYFDKLNCEWTFLKDCAIVFQTHSKAYSAMQKINKKYGYKRCQVININKV